MTIALHRIDLTVAIPTFRRWNLLRGAIASVVSQSVDCSVEVLVIDSAQDDENAQSLGSLTLPATVRVVGTRKPGASHARNVALKEARGDLVAFLDDDAVATPGWLAAIAAAYIDREVAAAGGPIIPLFTTTPPRWLQEAYDLIANEFSKLDHGSEACVLEYPKTVYGPNFSVRRRAAIENGGFREDLGPRGYRWSPGEETELVDKLQAKGLRVLWVPSAVVIHLVLPYKMTRGFYRRRSYARGVASANPLGKLSERTAFVRAAQGSTLRSAASIVYHFVWSQVMWVLKRRREAVFHDRIWSHSAGIVVGKVRRSLNGIVSNSPRSPLPYVGSWQKTKDG